MKVVDWLREVKRASLGPNAGQSMRIYKLGPRMTSILSRHEGCSRALKRERASQSRLLQRKFDGMFNLRYINATEKSSRSHRLNLAVRTEADDAFVYGQTEQNL